MKRRGAGTLSRTDIGAKVLLQAWVQRRRDHGGVLFLDLRDRSGVAQVVAKRLAPRRSASSLISLKVSVRMQKKWPASCTMSRKKDGW